MWIFLGIGSLRDDLREDVVRVCKVGGEEGGEGAEPLVQGLALVPERRLGALGERSVCRVHQHVLQRLLHSHVARCLGSAMQFFRPASFEMGPQFRELQICGNAKRPTLTKHSSYAVPRLKS